MNRSIVLTREHSLNLDRSARLVTENRQGGVYQVAGGYVATLASPICHSRCFEGTFDTVSDAVAAIEVRSNG